MQPGGEFQEAATGAHAMTPPWVPWVIKIVRRSTANSPHLRFQDALAKIAVSLRRLLWTGSLSICKRLASSAALQSTCPSRFGAELRATRSQRPPLHSIAPANALIRRHQPCSHRAHLAHCPFLLLPTLLRHGTREDPNHRLMSLVNLPCSLHDLRARCCHLGGRPRQAETRRGLNPSCLECYGR
ncbi:hypothetical protein PMIN06_007091 [Paraphaeosphaeria minitans]